jgi:hypothetical protein
VESGAFFEGQTNAGEGGVEFAGLDESRAQCRIEQASAAGAIEPLQNHEMIEVPKQDAWEGNGSERFDFVTEAAPDQTMERRGGDNRAGLRTVA